MTRIILLGGSSFIARAIAGAAAQRGVAWTSLPHDAPLDILGPSDSLINFALSPAYRTAAYDAAKDCDLRAATAAAQAGAWFGMLSTRRVYGPQERWNATEAGPALGDETAYGRNKARTEETIRTALSGQAGIFRLSNIFGYEYDRDGRRKSFLGIMLTSLKQNNKIHFDMSPNTRRDFLPVEICAGLLVDRAVTRTTGTYNLGSGIALPCGMLANWIQEGYEGGNLICDPETVRDEFYLNMDKWRADFALPIDQEILREYCAGLGRRLKCEKS
jgi:UDP-glucose 4-epimerase